MLLVIVSATLSFPMAIKFTTEPSSAHTSALHTCFKMGPVELHFEPHFELHCLGMLVQAC